MKKLIILSAVAACALLSGCGNSWEVTKKSINSDFGDLVRHVKVYDSRTKETIWTHTGPVYVTDKSEPGNITLIYRDASGKFRKNDFIGENLSIVMLEAVPGEQSPFAR